MDKFNQVIEYVKRTCWQDDTETSVVIEQAHKVFNEISSGKTKANILYRICGQTGSGKTSQLLSNFERINIEKNINPVILGVRTCAEYHPKYEYFKANFPSGELREKTNGFALKCMSYVLKLLVENGFMVILDMTLLDPAYEEFVLKLAKNNKYKINYQILAVNDEISKLFIEKRFKATGRIIYKSSADYFNKILIDGLKYICETDKTNSCFVWNAFDKVPVFIGLVSACFETFMRAKNEIKEFIHTEDELRNAKYEILKDKLKF